MLLTIYESTKDWRAVGGCRWQIYSRCHIKSKIGMTTAKVFKDAFLWHTTHFHHTLNLSSFQIVGLSTNIRFLGSLASHPQFVSGEVHTGFIDQHYTELFPKRSLSSAVLCQAAAALLLQEQNQIVTSAFATSAGTSAKLWLAKLENMRYENQWASQGNSYLPELVIFYLHYTILMYKLRKGFN